MKNKLSYLFLVICCCLNNLVWVEEIWVPPTQRYLSQNSLEEVKYNLRLDNVTLEHKPIFDKAIAQETLGFFGYYAASNEFRVYQDLIRITFEEILLISVPDDFHFLAVPLYPERTINDLEEVVLNAFEGNLKIQNLTKQFLPFNPSLYANHKTIGFCPAKNFSLGALHTNFQDLYWLFEKLDLDFQIIERAFSIGKQHIGDENRVLLQLFDLSHENGRQAYEIIDRNSYPAWPSGYPFQNRAFSDYALNIIYEYPPQFFLLLNDAILNPNLPLVIKRYTKIQPSKIKAYEQELKDLIRSSPFDQLKRDALRQNLLHTWNN